MKIFIYCILFLLPFFASSQELVDNNENFFIQIMLEESSEDVYQLLETELQSNPFVRIIRLDRHSKGLLIGTHNLSNLDRSTFESWISNYHNKIECYYQGIHGVDTMYAFDEQFCSHVSPN